MTIPTEITPKQLRLMPLPQPDGGADKKSRGNVLVIAGGSEVPGAALLAGVGALRAGAGQLSIATCARNATALGIAVPEALVLGLRETPAGAIHPSAAVELLSRIADCDAVLLGPGLQDEEAIAALATELLENVGPGPTFVFDATAIKHLRAMRPLLKRHRGRIVVTPHAGEMAGLMGMKRSEVEADPLRIACDAATELLSVVALKGAHTLIAPPQGEPAICRKGNVGLATSGSGDVLAGIIAGLLARGTAPFAAACWGVYLHAKAGDHLAGRIGPVGFLAHELPLEIPGIMAELS
jgi:ADP-dependent NAD(P)H-hydrate dehydratase